MIIDELVTTLRLKPVGFDTGRAAAKQTLQQMKADASELEDAILTIRKNSTEKMTDEGRRRMAIMRATLAQQKKAIREADQDQKQIDQADAKRKKEQVQRNKEVGIGIGDVTNKVLGLAAAFGISVGLKDFIGATITGNANLGRLATTLGVSTEQLSAWEGAVRQVGGTTEDAAAAIGLLVQSAQQVKLTGWSPIVPLLIREGISPADLENPIKAYGELADKFHAMDPRQAAALGSMFSIPPSVVNLLIQGRAAMEGYMAAEARAYPIHKADADAAKQAQAQIALLKDSYGRLGNNVLNLALPPLIRFGDEARSFAETDWSKTQYRGQFRQIATDADGANAALVRFEKTVGVDLGPAVRGGFSVVLTWIDDTLREIAHLATAMDDVAHGKWGQAGAEAWAAIRESAAGDLASRLTGHGPANPIADRVTGARDTATANRALLSAPTGAPAANPEQAARRAAPLIAYFEKHGETAAQARGIAAGIIAEGGRPDAVNPTSGAYGIGQWLGARKAALFRQYGPHPTLANELQFMQSELSGGDRGGRSVIHSGTAEDTFSAYITKFMRPAPGRETEGDFRRGAPVLRTLIDGEPPPPPPPAVAPQLVASAAQQSSAAASGASSSTTISIGDVTVNTRATDARGIARDLAPALTREMAVQANTGLG